MGPGGRSSGSKTGICAWPITQARLLQASRRRFRCCRWWWWSPASGSRTIASARQWAFCARCLEEPPPGFGPALWPSRLWCGSVRWWKCWSGARPSVRCGGAVEAMRTPATLDLRARSRRWPAVGPQTTAIDWSETSAVVVCFRGPIAAATAWATPAWEARMAERHSCPMPCSRWWALSRRHPTAGELGLAVAPARAGRAAEGRKELAWLQSFFSCARSPLHLSSHSRRRSPTARACPPTSPWAPCRCGGKCQESRRRRSEVGWGLGCR